MTMTLPTQINLHTADHDADARARGKNGSFTMGTKVNGNMPLTSNAAQGNNTTGSSQTGTPGIAHWEFAASPSEDVSSDTILFVWTWQFNAPNRVQVSDVGNDGIVFRIGSGNNSPPTDYKHFQIGGNDTIGGSAREQPKMIIIDLNDVSNESSGGTFDNTDVQTYGYGTVRFNISGNNTNLNFWQRAWLFDTTKNASRIPRFTGTSDWDDLVDLIQGTDHSDIISNEWAGREGNVFTIACPIEFGDNSVETDFNDAGAFVFWPDSDVANDPRVRVTSQAFRVYANLRNNAADTLTLSGFYDCGNSFPAWDFDLDFACTITLTGATFKRTGIFDMGSSVTGAATFDDCEEVNLNHADADLDGSTFRNPAANYLLTLVP